MSRHHRDRAFWRHRILLGVFAAVALYAVAGVPKERWRSLLPANEPPGPTRVVIRAFDAIVRPGLEATLRVKVQKLDALRLYPAASGVRVRFKLDESVVGWARTGVDGTASYEWLPPALGAFSLRASIDSEGDFAGEDAPFRVGAYNADDRLVVVDFDGTLTQPAGLRLPFDGRRVPEPMPGAAEALTAIAGSYHVVYLTGRDDRSISLVRSYLDAKGFPPGIALFRDFELIGAGLADYKRHEILRLRTTFPNLAFGIGDEVADALACARAGVSPILLASEGREALPPETTVLASWAEVKAHVLER
jgi:hypothetical protein